MGRIYKELTTINGLRQGMIIDECSDKNAPVALFIHGGPGSPEHIIAYPYLPQLNDFMTTCYHEQRGSGLSYNKGMPASELTTKNIIDDARLMIDFLCKKYEKEKIIVIGHSWGTYIGFQLAQVYPEKIAAYVGMGQIANQFDAEWDTVHYLLEKTAGGEQPKLREKILEHVDEPDFVRTKLYMQIRAQGLNYFGGGLLAEPDKNLNKNILKDARKYPYYTWKEKWTFLASALKHKKTLMTLFDEVLSTDLVKEEVTLEMPLYIFEGDHDYQTSHIQARRLFERTHAPKKEYVAFTHSAHAPFMDEPNKYREALEVVVKGKK